MGPFQQSDHFHIASQIEAGRVAVFFTRGGPIVLRALAPHNPLRIIGEEPDGSIATLFVEAVDGWSIAEPGQAGVEEDDGPFTINALPPLNGEGEGSSLDMEYMNAWQNAFMALRAACDASADPAVALAVANLEAIEQAGTAKDQG